jgi:uncharacterized protein
MAKIPTGRFVWFEYMSKDTKKAQAFFGELFHWKTKESPVPNGTYTMITIGDQTIGGYLAPPPGAPEHAHWVSHLQVENIKDTAAKVKQLGGKIAKEPFAVADMGTMAIVVDPIGAAFALWQPKRVEGSGDYSGKDGSWVWNELYTDDIDKAIAFYKQIGGFDVESMPSPQGERYEIIKSDGKGRGGIMKMAGVPPMWIPYVKVANTDATVEQAKRLGATVRTVETVPGAGRLAVLIDPQGAPIGILQPQPM